MGVGARRILAVEGEGDARLLPDYSVDTFEACANLFKRECFA
jgi:hypothetical protein